MPPKTIEEIIADMPRIKCATCNGEGWDVQADSHGEPEQVQCQDCHAEGTYTTLDCVKTAVSQDRQAHCDELVRRLESKKKVEKWTVMTSLVVDEKAIAYNQAIDQALTIVKEVYKVTE